jgi:RNA polymerase sigma factor (sigma-70 family)
MHLVTTSATVASVAADRLSASDTAISLSAGELCDQYAARVYQFASMVAGSDLEAEDLAQSALERALRGLPRFDNRKGQVEAWLWRIVVNVARDAGRAAVRRQRLWQRLVQLRSGWTGNDDIPLGIDDDRLLEGIRMLTPRQRSVLALRFGADLDYAGVASALGISSGAAAVATHRALVALRRKLLEESR